MAGAGALKSPPLSFWRLGCLAGIPLSMQHLHKTSLGSAQQLSVANVSVEQLRAPRSVPKDRKEKFHSLKCYFCHIL